MSGEEESYKNFLDRLKQYRLRLDMTQKVTSSDLGITQSQFSKMELGKTIVPYQVLERLREKGWDVDYLFTGKESLSNPSELSEMIEGADRKYGKELLRATTWLLEQGIKKCVLNISFEAQCEIEILRMRADRKKSETVLYEVRKTSGIAQVSMSEKLGVNIKKYRKLEKELLNPDAELLLRIYKATGCRPSLLFNNADVEKLIIDDLWKYITPPVRQQILSLVEQIKLFFEM